MNIEINDGLKTIYVLRGTKVSELLEFLEQNKKYVEYEISSKIETIAAHYYPQIPTYPTTPYTPTEPPIVWCGAGGVLSVTGAYC